MYQMDVDMRQSLYLILFLFLCISCSTADQRAEKRRMKENESSERIYRLSHQKFYEEKPATLVKKEPYPWESGFEFPLITMDHFRCRGHGKVRSSGDKEFKDCQGLADHGLPYGDNDERVFPVLIKHLNQLQKDFEKKVVITSAHRCPKHHAFLTYGKSKISRYMIGAKVDFYLEGLQHQTDQVVDKLKSYYKGDEGYESFYQVRNKDGTISWHNKEVIITVNHEGEHKDLDKLKHPVVSIDVRYDREKSENIVLDWKRAYEGYIRN